MTPRVHAKYLTSFAASLYFSLRNVLLWKGLNVRVWELIAFSFLVPCKGWAWLNKERKNSSYELLCSPLISLSGPEIWSEAPSKGQPVNERKVKSPPSTTWAPTVDGELANEQVILKASQGVWERLSSAQRDWVVLVLFRGVEAGVAHGLNLNNFGMAR